MSSCLTPDPFYPFFDKSSNRSFWLNAEYMVYEKQLENPAMLSSTLIKRVFIQFPHNQEKKQIYFLALDYIVETIDDEIQPGYYSLFIHFNGDFGRGQRKTLNWTGTVRFEIDGYADESSIRTKVKRKVIGEKDIPTGIYFSERKWEESTNVLLSESLMQRLQKAKNVRIVFSDLPTIISQRGLETLKRFYAENSGAN